MTEDELGKILVDCTLNIDKALGPGLLEPVYVSCGLKLGILIDFNMKLLKNGIKGVVNHL